LGNRKLVPAATLALLVEKKPYTMIATSAEQMRRLLLQLLQEQHKQQQEQMASIWAFPRNLGEKDSIPNIFNNSPYSAGGRESVSSDRNEPRCFKMLDQCL
jgi:hypothetical protein